MNPEPCSVSRVLVTIDEGWVRSRVVLPRKETTTMNYRDYNPNASCLPAEAYPYLALALGQAKSPRPTLWGRIKSTLRRYAVLPLAMVFLPLADPPSSHLNRPPDQNSLVWTKNHEGGERPRLLPLIVEGNPYSL